MGKAESVAARKADLLAAQDGALQAFGEGCYDDGVASVPPADADEQAKIDAAVAAAVAPLQQQLVDLQAKDAADLQAALDAKSAADAALADLQGKFDALAQKEGVEASIIAGLQGSLATLQDIVAKLSSLPAVP